MVSKAIIILVLLVIFFSLASGLVFLIQNKGDGKSMLVALTWRIGLSIGLFLFLMISFFFGTITPHGL